ncbi:MAG: hypothetical protein EBU33_05915, partial [Sphingobacteriia bacterium]|nr:hypothetical protein [Sphingobacteriia bacterium]
EFDHIVSIAQGGDNSLSNLGLACTEANRAKRHLSVDDFLFLCKEITEFNGFHVSK